MTESQPSKFNMLKLAMGLALARQSKVQETNSIECNRVYSEPDELDRTWAKWSNSISRFEGDTMAKELQSEVKKSFRFMALK